MSRVVLVLTLFTLTGFFGCGSIQGENPNGSDRLKIHLEIPKDEDPDYFWLDVSVKKLQINGRESREIPWTSGSIVELDIESGDSVVFQGLDSQGNLLVTGQAQVSEEKTLTISVAKVL